MRHAVIMAGGSGTRLWPLSRQDQPKQFQSFLGKDTLIQQTLNRIEKLFQPSNIWVSTLEEYKNIVVSQLKKLGLPNIICEPIGRNTAPSIAYATMLIMKKDPTALIATIPSDHYIGKDENLRQALKSAFNFLSKNQNYLVTLGINPTEPNTGLGYIKMGEQIVKGKYPIFKVDSFHEKPDKQTAQKFFEQWEYLWNGGFFVFSAQHLMDLYRFHQPKMLEKINQFITSNEAKIYRAIESEPIDKAIAEKTDKLAVLPVDLDWSDLGTWSSLQEVLSKNGQYNIVVVGRHIGLETKGSLIFSREKLVATLGIENLIVINTEDAVLICNRDKVQDVKKLVDLLKEQGRIEYI